VHRDVSIGNILSCDGVAKLADLEYAKIMGDSESQEMRTASKFRLTLRGKLLIASQQGTTYFMSVEVAARQFLFIPRKQAGLPPMDNFLAAPAQTEVMAQTGVPFSHNHLHDLESLWWVAVWVVFYNYFTPSCDDPTFVYGDVVDQLNLARTLFPLELGSAGRQIGFQNSATFRNKCNQLPPNKTVICGHLNYLRELLIADYDRIEAGYPLSVDPKSSNDEIHDGFIRFFSNLKTLSYDLVLNFIPDIYIELSKSKAEAEDLKRLRSESTADAGVAQKAPRT
jgi:serine/threonine protein kinase